MDFQGKKTKTKNNENWSKEKKSCETQIKSPTWICSLLLRRRRRRQFNESLSFRAFLGTFNPTDLSCLSNEQNLRPAAAESKTENSGVSKQKKSILQVLA